jgi:hypothetical protein
MTFLSGAKGWPYGAADQRTPDCYTSLRKQGNVHGVVRMMVADKDVGHVLGGDPHCFERVQNESSIGDHAWVSHHNRMIALDEGDGTRHASNAIIRRAGDELTPLDGLDIPCSEHGDFIHEVPPPDGSKLPWS